MPAPKTCVITGATSGIGRALAITLAAQGCTLILLGRDAGAGEALARRLSRHTSQKAEFLRVDLAEQDEVRSTADTIVRRHPVVDVLVNNAGARHDTFATNRAGIERTFAVNHLGHFLLTARILDALAASQAGRIFTVTSSAAAQARRDGVWALDADHFDRRQAYAKSKLANKLFAFELSARLAATHMRSVAFDPGIVLTRFARNNGLLAWLKHLLYHGLRGELVLSGKPAAALARLAFSPELPPHPQIGYCTAGSDHAEPIACDRTESSGLWRLSVELAGLATETGDTWKRINADPTPMLRTRHHSTPCPGAPMPS